MSIKQLKLLANCLSMIAAIMFLGALFIVYIQPEFVNKIGTNSISVHRLSYSSDAKSVLGGLAQNKTSDAVALLQTKKWNNVLLGDTPYYLKREILSRLCEVLSKKGDYETLLYWASEWRDSDERDVDAMAFWYQALSHTVNQRQEGIKGLYEGAEKFPENILFQRFYVQSQHKSEENLFSDTVLSNEQLFIVENAMTAWELRWRWKLRHAIKESIAELQSEFAMFHLRGVWGALVRATQIVIYAIADDHANEKGHTGFSIFPDKDNWMQVTATIPRQTTTLRIDFPPFFRGAISDFNIAIDGVFMPVSDKLFEYGYATAERNLIVTDGFEDARFQLNISSLDRSGDGLAMTVNVRFKLLITDVFDNTRLLSYEMARDSLSRVDE